MGGRLLKDCRGSLKLKRAKPLAPSGSESKRKDRSMVWFCSAYQRNKCELPNGHSAKIKGVARNVCTFVLCAG